MRARQRLSKLLLRHDVIYEDTASAWTARHRAWLTAIDLGGGAQLTLLDYLGAIDALVIRRDALQASIAELVSGSPWAQTVARLRCLRGIDTLSAVGLCAEVGDFQRFDCAARLMSYLGLVPSEDSSGEKRRQGAITKTGSRHARRLLVEAAWHYRRPRPRPGAQTPPGRTARPRPCDLLAGSAAPAPRLAASGSRPRQAPHDRRRRRRARARRVLLGARQRGLNAALHHVG